MAALTHDLEKPPGVTRSRARLEATEDKQRIAESTHNLR